MLYNLYPCFWIQPSHTTYTEHGWIRRQEIQVHLFLKQLRCAHNLPDTVLSADTVGPEIKADRDF